MTYRRKRAFGYHILMLLASLTILFSCSGVEDENKYVAEVNDTPISLEEFEREVSVASRRDPTLRITDEALENILDTMIEKRLMIEEAVNNGLSEDEKFIETIKTFWEQTLIRELIDLKTKQWSDRLFVTEDEIKNYHKLMGYRVTFRTVKVTEEAEAEEAQRRLARGEPVEGARTVGPVLLENISYTNPLYEAFNLSEGETRTIRLRDGFLVVQVIKREKVDPPELSEVYDEIKSNIYEYKKQQMLDKWLEDLKRSSHIKVNKELLKEVADE